jgi:hypothetical protein
MRRIDEAEKTQKSSRRRAWPLGWARAQRGQAAGQSGQWPQGRLGQKSGQDARGPAQCPPSAARTTEEAVNLVIALIRARYGETAIGRGAGGIHYHCHP